MNRYLPIIIIAVIAAAVGVGLASMNKNINRQASTTTPPPATSTTNNGTSGTSSTTNLPTASADEVVIEDMTFRPAITTIKKGATVTWTNKDDVGHMVKGRSAAGPKSQMLNRDQSYSFTFNEVGEFEYFCESHPSMTGKVTVTQ